MLLISRFMAIMKQKIQDKQWIAYVYQFDKSVLDLIGKKIVQNDRNFVMKNK